MKRDCSILFLALALGACGSFGDVENRRNLFLSGVRTLDPTAPAPPGIDDIRAFIPEALARTEGPLLLVEQPDFDRAEFFVQAGRNGPVTTFGSDSQSTVALNGPVMVATRGFGGDLMSADVGDLPTLLGARQSGSHERRLRYLDGEDRTTVVRLQCDLRPGDPSATVFIEYCGAAELELRNIYQFGSDGRVEMSVQWHGPQNGYIVIRHLR